MLLFVRKWLLSIFLICASLDNLVAASSDNPVALDNLVAASSDNSVSLDNLVAAVSDNSAVEANVTEPYGKALTRQVNGSKTLLIFGNDTPISTTTDDLDQSTDDEVTPLARVVAVRSSLIAFAFPFILAKSGFGSITTIVVLQKGALRSSCSVYVRGVAVANTISVLLFAPAVLNAYKAISSNLAWHNFYQYLVLFTVPLNYAIWAIESWTVIALALERLLAIFKPLKARVICSESRAKKIVCGIYIVATLVNLPRCFSRAVKTEINPDTNVTRLVWYHTEFGKDPLHNMIESLFFTIAGAVAPVVLLGMLNIMIILKLQQRRKKQQALKEGMAEDITKGADAQVERVLVASISSFFVCHVLGAIAFFLLAVHGPSVFQGFEYNVLKLVMSLLYYCYPFINFILYVCCSQILRGAVKDLFCCRN